MNDPITEQMEVMGLPKTRESYVALMTLFEPDRPLSAEEEAGLPEQFRSADAYIGDNE